MPSKHDALIAFRTTATKAAILRAAAEVEDVRVSEFVRRAIEARVREIMTRPTKDQ